MEVETTIRIQNLHCESCVRTIQELLSNLSPTPASIDTHVGIQSVTVVHKPSLLTQQIQSALLDAGFGIAVESLDTKGTVSDHKPMILPGKSGMHEQFCLICRQESPVPASPAVASLATPVEERANGSHRYRARLSVGGMSCASCSRTITEAVENIPGIDRVAINHIDSSATCELESERLADIVRDTIEECGYEARVVNVEPERWPAHAGKEASLRTIALKVDGVSGPQGPKKVMSAIGSIGNGVTIEKPLTTHTDPILIISYVPKLPSFTIRDIVSAIESSNDPPFHVNVHHPPTIEEFTRIVQAREMRDVLFRFIFAIIAAIPTFVIGVVYMSLIKDGNPGKMYLMEPFWNGNASRLEWALFFIATPVMFYSANIFHRCTVKEIRALWKNNSVTLLRRFTRFGSMNLLATSGVSVAYFASLALFILAATRPPGNTSDNTTYFDAVVFLTMFLLMGRYLDVTSKSRTRDAITALSALRPSEALLVVPDSFSPNEKSMEALEGGPESQDNGYSASMFPGSKMKRVSVDLLEIGDVICVPCGATPSADGTLIKGESSMFNESSLTGESRLVSKQSGDKVYVGTINKGRMVHVKVDAIGEGTMLENIVKVVREGQTRHAPIERVANKITSYFVPVITFLAIVTWLVWLILGISGALPRDYLDIKTGGWTVWSLRFAIAVFVVACPCGIGLAAPTAFTVGLGIAAKNGILAQGGGEAFQEMSQLDVIVFDKTGTLTEGGEPCVTDFVCFAEGKWTEDVIKRVAAALESASSHPLAGAVRRYCSEKETADMVASECDEIPGRGLKASFEGFQCTAIIGNESWMHEHGVVVDDGLMNQLEKWKAQGRSIALAAMCDTELPAPEGKFRIVAAFAIADTIRPNAAEVIAWFQKQGIDTWMMTGDNAKTAEAIASSVGIPHGHVISGVLPHEKSEKVQQLQQGRIGTRHCKTGRNVVAMVGDGINDGPALAVADVGVAIGSGSDVAISSASFILVSSNLSSLAVLRDLSTRVINRVKFNFVWAMAYNLIAVPIAAGAIYPARHIRLDPVWASLAMALSSCSVIFSSLLLKTYKAPKLVSQWKGEN